ncbi:hypothetical protein ATANTOWER_005460, partial [Ataeniobius toweri]|nr:hypothetical protein [Ataeniobius toweri]
MTSKKILWHVDAYPTCLKSNLLCKFTKTVAAYCVRCCFVFSPRFGLLQDESLWLESEEAEVLSVELDLTERTDGIAVLKKCSLGFARTPTDAELLHSRKRWQSE